MPETTVFAVEQGAFVLSVGTTPTPCPWGKLEMVVSDTLKEVTSSDDYDATSGMLYANYLKTKQDISFNYEGPRKEAGGDGALQAGQQILQDASRKGGTLAYVPYSIAFTNGDALAGTMLVKNLGMFGGSIDDNVPFKCVLQNCGKPTFTPHTSG
jgi:hypothetical protein